MCQWVWCKILLDLLAFLHRVLHHQPANEFYTSQMLKLGGSPFTVEPVPDENRSLTKDAADFVMPHQPRLHATSSPAQSRPMSAGRRREDPSGAELLVAGTCHKTLKKCHSALM